MKPKLCGKLIKKPGMPEPRPCLQKKNHNGSHTPDLTGLKNVFGYVEILHRGPDYIGTNGHCTRWIVLDKFGDKINVRAHGLFSGCSTGSIASKGSLNGFRSNGKVRAEYSTVKKHFQMIFNKKDPRHSSYKDMKFFDGWNTKKGAIIGALWIVENLGPKPGPNYQMHVLKTEKYPHGYFGPDDRDGRHIVWRHKMDRHDQDLLDLIHEWPKEKLHEFVREEIQPLLAA